MNSARAPSFSYQGQEWPKQKGPIHRSSPGGFSPSCEPAASSQFRVIDLIRKKRDGGALSAAEIG